MTRAGRIPFNPIIQEKPKCPGLWIPRESLVKQLDPEAIEDVAEAVNAEPFEELDWVGTHIPLDGRRKWRTRLYSREEVR